MQTFDQEHYPSEKPGVRVRRELRDARASVEKTHRFISDDLPFLFDQLQYQGHQGREQRPDLIQPTDSQPYENWRHRKGVALQNAPIHLRCEPVDKESDLLKAEAFKHRLNYQLTGNRFVNYQEVRERWIGGALAARAWAYRWDFEPRLGAFGEVVPKLVDPRMMFIPEGYLSPHDPMCPRLHEVFRIPINEARRHKNWKNTADLKPDAGTEVMEWVQGGTGDPYYNQSERDQSTEPAQGMATFCMTWYRFEDEKVKVEKDVPLEPGQRYLQCLNEACNFKSPREYELAEMMGDPAYTLPAQEQCAYVFPETGLPCGATMRRVSKDTKSDEQMRYEQGKRLLITCLNGSVEDEIYDGPWPCADCPTYPYAWLTCEKEPHRLYPESDVSTGRSMTIARNFTAAALYQQIHASRPIMLFPRVGIEDANGMPADHMDELADVLFYNSDLPTRAVDVIQGTPVNAALFELYALLSNVSDKNESGSRVSLGAEQSKDIPVGTLKQLIDSGNVPTNTFITAIYAAESISFTNLSCYIRKFDTEQRWIRFRNAEGKRDWALVRGIDMPDVDVVCSAGPVLSNIKAEEIAAIQQLNAMPGPLRRLAGRSMGIDESLLDELDEAQRLMPAPPGAPGVEPPEVDAPQPQTNGAPV